MFFLRVYSFSSCIQDCNHCEWTFVCGVRLGHHCGAGFLTGRQSRLSPSPAAFWQLIQKQPRNLCVSQFLLWVGGGMTPGPCELQEPVQWRWSARKSLGKWQGLSRSQPVPAILVRKCIHSLSEVAFISFCYLETSWVEQRYFLKFEISRTEPLPS